MSVEKILIVALSLIFLGVMIVVIGGLLGGFTGGFVSIVLIGPIPIIVGEATSPQVLLILIIVGLLITILATIFWLIYVRRTLSHRL